MKHPLRGTALYLVERSFDPINQRMDDEIVGARAGEDERLRIPFDPLTIRTRRRTAAGTVLSVGEDLTSIMLHTAKGRVRLAFPDENDPLRLGDPRYRRVYPLGLETRLAGREADVEKYEDGTEPVLWLKPAREGSGFE